MPAWLPLLLGFLQAVGPVSTDMYLPAFPAIDVEFHAAAGAAQVTLATWVAGISLGQLLQGALADRFGRRMPLLLGTALYTVASAGCALAPSIFWLAFWRFWAAVGGSASMIVPRAVVRDLADGPAAARIMSRLILILGVAPVLAPSLGGAVLTFATWRDIFWIMAGYGLLGLILAAWKLPDTLPANARTELHPVRMLGRYRHILTERTFITHALLVASSAFSLFAYLSGSPNVFIGFYHFSPGAYAVTFGAVAAAYVAMSQLSVPFTHRLGLGGTLTVASWLYLTLAAALLALARVQIGGPIVFACVLASVQGCTGLLGPAAMVGALSRHAGHAGSASAVMGTLQFGIGSLSAFIMAGIGARTPVPMAALMFCGALAIKTADLCRPAPRPAHAPA